MPPLNLYACVRIFFAHIGAPDRGRSAHSSIPRVVPGTARHTPISRVKLGKIRAYGAG
jgi:hypothetical protein